MFTNEVSLPHLCDGGPIYHTSVILFAVSQTDVLNTAYLSSASSCNLTAKYALLAFASYAGYEMNFTFEGVREERWNCGGVGI